MNDIERKKKRAAYDKIYRAINKEVIAKRIKKWKLRNPECVKIKTDEGSGNIGVA